MRNPRSSAALTMSRRSIIDDVPCHCHDTVYRIQSQANEYEAVSAGWSSASRSSVLERRRPLLEERPLASVMAEPARPLELGDRLRPPADAGAEVRARRLQLPCGGG